MPSTIAVSGSLAYDTVFHLHGEFHRSIDPAKLENLNVAFLIHHMERSFGGTAGNIAYNLHLLDDEVSLHAMVGDDGKDYVQRIRRDWGMSLDHVVSIPGQPSAHAYIMTDERHNQVTGFHAGALGHGTLSFTKNAKVDAAIVSPDSMEHMLQAGRHWVAHHVPYAFDPGQAVYALTPRTALELGQHAWFTIVNAYEEGLLRDLVGAEAFTTVFAPRLVVTQGAQGVLATVAGERIALPPGKPDAVVDPTGCGDSFRAGLLHGLTQGWSWRDALALGSTMGAIKVAHKGGQGHEPTLLAIRQAFERDFGVWPS